MVRLGHEHVVLLKSRKGLMSPLLERVWPVEDDIALQTRSWV